MWKLDAESKFIVDILEEQYSVFNELGKYVIFVFLLTPLAKYQRKNLLSKHLPFIFQVEGLFMAFNLRVYGIAMTIYGHWHSSCLSKQLRDNHTEHGKNKRMNH